MTTSGSIKVSGKYRVILPALAIFLLLCTDMFRMPAANAATRYVKPTAEVVVRTGQGNEYRIVGMVKDGASVEVLEDGDSYSRVRLASGVEGWMLKRYLSNTPPVGQVVTALRSEKEELKKSELEYIQKFEEVSAALTAREKELQTAIAERNKVATDYQKLQRDTADVVKLKNDMLKAMEENDLLAQKLAVIEEENNSLKKDKAINWFLAGGGVLIAGILIGRMPSPARKRKPSLL